MNIIGLWLELIGTPERAKKLYSRVDGLKSPPLDPLIGPEPPQDPLIVLYGPQASQSAYSDPRYRPALDAWDMGFVSPSDLKRYCLYVAKGGYDGPVFDPNVVITNAKRRGARWIAQQKQQRVANRVAKPKSPMALSQEKLEAAFLEAFGPKHKYKA